MHKIRFNNSHIFFNRLIICLFFISAAFYTTALFADDKNELFSKIINLLPSGAKLDEEGNKSPSIEQANLENNLQIEIVALYTLDSQPREGFYLAVFSKEKGSYKKKWEFHFKDGFPDNLIIDDINNNGKKQILVHDYLGAAVGGGGVYIFDWDGNTYSIVDKDLTDKICSGVNVRSTGKYSNKTLVLNYDETGVTETYKWDGKHYVIAKNNENSINDDCHDFIGMIAGYGVEMHLCFDGKDITGKYNYIKHRNDFLEVDGELEDGEITMVEHDDKGNTTGSFVGRINDDKNKFDGEWMSGDKKKALPFNFTMKNIVNETQGYDISKILPPGAGVIKVYFHQDPVNFYINQYKPDAQKVCVFSADVDNDGINELIVAYKVPLKDKGTVETLISVFKKEGNGWKEIYNFGNDFARADFLSFMDVKDLFADGNKEIVMGVITSASIGGDVMVLKWNGKTFDNLITLNDPVWGICLADLNKNGKYEIICRKRFLPSIVIYDYQNGKYSDATSNFPGYFDSIIKRIGESKYINGKDNEDELFEANYFKGDFKEARMIGEKLIKEYKSNDADSAAWWIEEMLKKIK